MNPDRFDPYKNLKFRPKWDGRYIAGISKRSPLVRRTEVIRHREGRDPSTERKSPGRTDYDVITLERGITHDTAFEDWANKACRLGAGAGTEVGLVDFRTDIILDMFNEAGRLVLSYKILSLPGVGVSGDARLRCQRERRSDRTHQARE